MIVIARTGINMKHYDPRTNPLNKYKVRNLVLSLIDSDHFAKIIAVIGVTAIVIHQLLDKV
jgi:hypothetical protein